MNVHQMWDPEIGRIPVEGYCTMGWATVFGSMANAQKVPCARTLSTTTTTMLSSALYPKLPATRARGRHLRLKAAAAPNTRPQTAYQLQSSQKRLKYQAIQLQA